jgi:hypothetical protein
LLDESEKVNPLNETGLSYLPQYRKEKLIREQRATNDRLGIPNPPYSDSSDINAKEEACHEPLDDKYFYICKFLL